jgi:predicted transcriptional regulator
MGWIYEMTEKRSRLEMYLDVLEKINAGINRPTNIMYKCNLSWIPMKEILDSLIDKELIQEIEIKDKKTYEITKKGQDILKYLESVLEAFDGNRRKVIPFQFSRESPSIMTRLSRHRSLSPITQIVNPSDNDDSQE